jgi:pimeloyl-ACP methyl ester carboxylesterase
MLEYRQWWALCCLLLTVPSGPASAQGRYLVRYADVQIEVVAEGEGQLIVFLPSLGRDSDDYDQATSELARRGYRVVRPVPRGIGQSHGPSGGITLRDYARDVAKVIEHEARGPAVIVGHAYGNWVARMAAVDHPRLVRGIVIAAAGAKHFPTHLSGYIDKCEDASLPDEERLRYLQLTFFAHGNNPKSWLKGWHPEVKKAQRAARAATRIEAFWSGGDVPVLDLVAAEDPFRPATTRNENRDELGSRVTVAVVPNASHALIPEQPSLVVDALTQWMAQLPTGEGRPRSSPD